MTPVTTFLWDVLDIEALDREIKARNVSRQFDETGTLAILNYTAQAMFDRVWNHVTMTCRGLIYNVETGEVLARPWPKFFNYGDPTAGDLDLNAPVEVTDKEDGSLGILYTAADGRPAIATRGSFRSEQAQHATALYRERYESGEWDPAPGYTHLFEIVFPANRIVRDYGALDDLILLGAVFTEDGDTEGPAKVARVSCWPGPVATTFDYATLADALTAEPRPGAEGFVIRYLDGPLAGTMVKIKQDDYKILHGVLTNTSPRRIWTLMAVHACKGYIREFGEWQARLALDPGDVRGALDTGDDWLEQLVDATPDEFHDWLRQTIAEILANVIGTIRRWQDEAQQVVDEAGPGATRAAHYALARATSDFTPIMHAIDGNWAPVYLRAWRLAYPGHGKPFMTISEDVA